MVWATRLTAAGYEMPAWLRSRQLRDVCQDGDLIITVCDLAHEELGELAAVHWSVPDPVPAGQPASFDAALAALTDRVERLAPHLAPVL